MQALRNHIATVLLLIAACGGCTDKDRELAKRTGDGSGTFKYKTPTATLPAEGPSANLAKPEATQPKRKGDGSDTFQYKPDARGFPAAPKSGK
jgi:hypothetical protein